jgi:hypothetical protein
MKKLIQHRSLVTLGVFALTAASFAQYSNPGDDVPAYTRRRLSKSAPCHQFSRATNSPARISVTPGRCTSISKWPKLAAWPISSPATADATALWDIPACAVVSRACTALNAQLAPKRVCLLSSRQNSARPRPRFARPLPATNTSPSISRSSRNPPKSIFD